jgi:DDE superfamily endonuclease
MRIGHIVEQYPFARTIHLVMENLNIHCRRSLIDYFGDQEGGYLWDRLTVHYTPKHGSWLNQAEIELSMFSRQCRGTRRIPSLWMLQQETHAWTRQTNRKRTRINWRFTRKKARKLFRYQKPQRIGNQHRLRP